MLDVMTLAPSLMIIWVDSISTTVLDCANINLLAFPVNE